MDPVIDNNWNRKMVRLFWWVLFIFEGAAMAGLGFELYLQPGTWLDSLLQYQILPTLAQLALMGLGYLALFYVKQQWHDYIVILWAALITSVYLVFIPELSTKYELLCLPIMLSSIYFQRKMVIYASALGFVCSAALFALNRGRDVSVSSFEVIVSYAVLIAFAFICYGVTSKGLYVLATLQQSKSREQELIIRNLLIEQLSKTDALSGLLNHRSFQEYTDSLLAHRSNGISFELALLDIDNFKSINDTFGHWAGDQVIKGVSEQIKALIGPEDSAFRYGGEEFAIIFTGKSPGEAFIECSRLLESIRSIVVAEIPGRMITVSIGLAAYQPEMNKHKWFQAADKCLYDAKKNGKDQVFVPA